jgi:Tol biopolymer transport system component
MKKIILSIFYSILIGQTFSQEDRSVIENATDQAKLFNAKQKFYGGEYREALKIYKGLFDFRPNDAGIAYYMGICVLNLGEVDDAVDYLEKARTLKDNPNSELHFGLGRAYHMQGQVDKAIQEFMIYRAGLTTLAKNQLAEVDHYLEQCVTAKKFIETPQSIQVENLGDVINSPYNDKKPSITADGKTMIFTSGRPDTKGGKIDKEGGDLYYDDVYLTTYDEGQKKWNEPDKIKGSINTDGHDACTSITQDGQQIFIYLNNGGKAEGGDIFVSKVSSSGKWGSPKRVGKPINSSWYEDAACLSPDGNTLYFVSESPKRAGAMGNGDIYMAKRQNKNDWEEPVNLGPVVNTIEDENGIFMAADGKTLYFSSKGHNSMGSYDIFRTVYENGQWSTPVNMGYPINTVGVDKTFIITSDNKTAYFVSNRQGGNGGDDIYKVDMSNYDWKRK